MNRIPDVSVIVPVYNGGRDVERALDSVVGQTLGLARIQVLVVDDGSTDDSPALLDRMAAEHPAIEVFHRPNSGGPAVPRNYGIERVRGRYMFFLDQDDYLSPDALEAMVRIADENGTDVVLPRMKGVGGRGVPLVMFTRTVPRTDVFSSSVYWTLNPLKLFRTEMVRSLGLRFDERSRVHEDIGFVTQAYIQGNGISILSDRDYLFWTNREDRSNITLSRMKLADRLPGVSAIFDLLGSLVPPGPKRDVLARRLFEVEGQSLCRVYGMDPDPVLRDATFAKLREIVAEYYTEAVDRAFLPRGRVLLRFVAEDDRERFLEYLEALAAAPGRPTELVEGERVFLQLPWFRDPAEALPDDLFDIGPKLSAFCRMDPLSIDPTGVHIGAICRLGALTDRITGASLIARPRSGSGDVVVRLVCDLSERQTIQAIPVKGTVPAATLLGLSLGDVYDLYLRVEAGEVMRERKVTESAPSSGKPRVVSGRGTSGARYGILTTGPKGALAFRTIDGPGLLRYRLGRLKRRAARAIRARLGRR